MTTIWQEIWAYLSASSLLWLSFTLFVYTVAATLYQRTNANPLLLPVITAVLCIIGFLYATETPYPLYAEKTSFLQFLIGPATVALAVPLYGQLSRLKRLFWPILVALVAGSATAILSAVAISRFLGASLQTQLSLAPKSATMPIAMEVAGLTGGLPSLTTVAVAITGIAAALIASPLFKMLNVENSEVEGFALGLAGHAIGTARAFQANETAGAFAALGMGLNGIATAVLIPVLLALLALV